MDREHLHVSMECLYSDSGSRSGMMKRRGEEEHLWSVMTFRVWTERMKENDATNLRSSILHNKYNTTVPGSAQEHSTVPQRFRG